MFVCVPNPVHPQWIKLFFIIIARRILLCNHPSCVVEPGSYFQTRNINLQMKYFKPCLFTVLTTLSAATGYAQGCGNLLLKDGSKLTLTAVTYPNAHATDVKFGKMKPEKQDEKILAYNADVASGKTGTATTYPMVFTAKKRSLPEGGDEYALTANIAGTDYTFYTVCRADTLFLCRNQGPVETPDGKGGIYGYSIQGVQKIPLKMKVGDKLPTFDDIIVVLPTSTDLDVKKSVFSHMGTKTTNESGFAVDSRTGQSFVGAYTKTTTSAVYKSIDVKVRQTLSSEGHIIHYVGAEVTGEEDITVSGVTYKTYIIESQTWSKQKLDASYESADEEVNREQKRLMDKMLAKHDKMMVKKQLTNDKGYMVSYTKEWFAPTLGSMLKSESYDMYGGIAGGSLVTSLE